MDTRSQVSGITPVAEPEAAPSITVEVKAPVGVTLPADWQRRAFELSTVIANIYNLPIVDFYKLTDDRFEVVCMCLKRAVELTKGR